MTTGQSCGSGGLACATGVCTSRDQQCQNAGSSLNIQRACPVSTSSTCSIICVDPTSSNQCVILDQSFRDGSPCGCESSASLCLRGAVADSHLRAAQTEDIARTQAAGRDLR